MDPRQRDVESGCFGPKLEHAPDQSELFEGTISLKVENREGFNIQHGAERHHLITALGNNIDQLSDVSAYGSK